MRDRADTGSPARAAADASGPAIRVRGLVKSYGATRALDGVDLEVARGRIFAILGPNGAGKTTLIRVLATLQRAEAGTASVMGRDVAADPAAVRRQIALTGQFAALDEDLTGRENLVMLARLRGFGWRAARGRAEALLAAFDLTAAAGRQVSGYSGGMRRRLDIAASLVVTPGVLFLDEPTTGLDPAARQAVWRVIRGLARAGVTVLLTTQYMEEADQLADRIAVIDRGRKIAEGSSRELKAAVGSGVLHVTPADPGMAAAAAEILAARLGAPVQSSPEGGRLSVAAPGPAAAAAAVSSLVEGGVAVSDFSLGAPSLEEVFFALTGTPEPAQGDATP